MLSQLDLQNLAHEIDAACDAAQTAGFDLVLQKCEDYLSTAVGTDRVDLHYFKANIHSALGRNRADSEKLWGWDQHEVIQEILSLRRAIAEPAFESCDVVRRSQIRTNLANSLSSVGRSVEAIEEYSCVIKNIPNFAMALGNRAYATATFSACLYDQGHQCLLLGQSRRDFRSALQPEAFWDSGFTPEVADKFAEKLSDINTHLDAIQFDHNFDLTAYSLGKTVEEVNYRQWCLTNGLYINPLNEITKEAIAANDVLHLPSHSYGLEEEIKFPAFYNILKQEYVSARYHIFSSQSENEDNFVDRDVLLLDSFDCGVFNFRDEQLKLAYRSAYSIFDKIALFLNDYFKVGLKPKQVSFRQIWQQKVKGGDTILREAFVGKQNLPLQGLYFLSKDFFDSTLSELASPEAKDLDKLRNFLEHRFVTLTELGIGGQSNDLHKRVDLVEFQKKTMRLLKLSRAALIYLSLAMHCEEQLRKGEETDRDSKITVPILSAPLSRN